LGPWKFHHLLHAPHRLAFASAALLLGLSGLWWAVVNLAAPEGLALRWGLAPSSAHSLLMTFGFMPLFFAGFLFTAGPKWLQQPPVRARSLLPQLLPQLVGWLVFMLAVHGRDPAFGRVLGAIGLGAVLFGWAGCWWRFCTLLCTSHATDRIHAQLVAAGGGVGIVALGLALWGVAAGDASLVRAATQIGLWGFIGLVFAAVAHRMIPFFSAAAVPSLDAWRPLWLLWLFVGVFAFEALAGAAEALVPGMPWGWTMARALVEIPAGAGCLALAVRWGLVQSLQIRLLAMLHLGFCWLGVALLLHGLSHAVMATGDTTAWLGLAPLHAYTMGYLGTTMFAMVTRVSCGHGGRTLAADDVVWRLFWVLQLAIVVRLAAAIAMPLDAAWGLALVAAAAIGWAGVCLAWACRYGHWYGTPRPDGRPG
jgi:uncharacterized protein involved in response to NO